MIFPSSVSVRPPGSQGAIKRSAVMNWLDSVVAIESRAPAGVSGGH